MHKSKLLITGGAGFIGSHIVDRFIDEGFEVVVIDDLSSGRKENINKNAAFYNIDIQDPGIEEIFRKETPDYVNHHAAQKDVRVSVADPILDVSINVSGSINILQNCLKYKVKKVVFASTGGAIYGEQDTFPADEEHPARPISPYGINKLVTEYYLYYYKTVYGMDYASLRYSNVYGPRQDPHGEAGVVAIFVQKMLKGEQPIINGDGEQTRDFVFVEDVVRANYLATINNTPHHIYNIGTGVETSVNKLFDSIRDIINPAVERRHVPAKVGEQMRSVIDNARAMNDLNWKPEISLESGLEKTCDFFRNG